MTIVSIQRPEEIAEFIRRAKAGEEIVIAADGTLMARLVPVDWTDAPTGPRRPGSMKELADIPDEVLFAPLPEEELRLWEGGEPEPK